MTKSIFLSDLEDFLRENKRDPITLSLWLKRAQEHIKELELKKPAGKPPKPSDSTPIQQPETPNEMFKREVERTLLSTIAPEDYQVNSLILTLKTFVKWKNKRQKSIIAEYEVYIRRAIQNLRARKAEMSEEAADDLVNTFMGNLEEE